MKESEKKTKILNFAVSQSDYDWLKERFGNNLNLIFNQVIIPELKEKVNWWGAFKTNNKYYSQKKPYLVDFDLNRLVSRKSESDLIKNI